MLSRKEVLSKITSKISAMASSISSLSSTVSSHTTSISSLNTDVGTLKTKATSSIVAKTFSKQLTVAANGFTTNQKITFEVPSGYTTLPGTAVLNNGYCFLYNNQWSKGATYANVSVKNTYNGQLTPTVYCNVTFIKSTLV